MEIFASNRTEKVGRGAGFVFSFLLFASVLYLVFSKFGRHGKPSLFVLAASIVLLALLGAAVLRKLLK